MAHLQKRLKKGSVVAQCWSLKNFPHLGFFVVTLTTNKCSSQSIVDPSASGKALQNWVEKCLVLLDNLERVFCLLSCHVVEGNRQVGSVSLYLTQLNLLLYKRKETRSSLVVLLLLALSISGRCCGNASGHGTDLYTLLLRLLLLLLLLFLLLLLMFNSSSNRDVGEAFTFGLLLARDLHCSILLLVTRERTRITLLNIILALSDREQ